MILLFHAEGEEPQFDQIQISQTNVAPETPMETDVGHCSGGNIKWWLRNHNSSFNISFNLNYGADDNDPADDGGGCEASTLTAAVDTTGPNSLAWDVPGMAMNLIGTKKVPVFHLTMKRKLY